MIQSRCWDEETIQGLTVDRKDCDETKDRDSQKEWAIETAIGLDSVNVHDHNLDNHHWQPQHQH